MRAGMSGTTQQLLEEWSGCGAVSQEFLSLLYPAWEKIGSSLFYPACIRMERTLRLESFALGSHSKSSSFEIIGCLKIIWGAYKNVPLPVFQFNNTWAGSQKAKSEAKVYIPQLFWEPEPQRSTRRAKGSEEGKERIPGQVLLSWLPLYIKWNQFLTTLSSNGLWNHCISGWSDQG